MRKFITFFFAPLTHTVSAYGAARHRVYMPVHI